MITLNSISSALGGEIKRDHVLAPGPGHSRDDRSLSIKPIADEPGFIVHSFAGDDPLACKDYVREKLGMPAFKPNGQRSEATTEPPKPQIKIIQAPSAETCIPWQHTELRRHVYKTPDGLEAKVKIKRTGNSYVQWFNINGQWQPQKPKDGGFPVVPYVTRSIDPFDPELVDDDIFWPEGEKDVETLDKLNLPAFTFGGTTDPIDLDVVPIAGRRVVILADNDDHGGPQHAEKKAKLATARGATVKVVKFDQKDVSDFIEAGHTVEALRQRVDAAVWTKGHDVPLALATTFTASALNAMTFQDIKFVVADFIAEGLTLFAGKPKIGKSWLLLHVAHEVAIGGYTLGGTSCEQGDVLYCALEDNQRRLKRRMLKLFDLGDWPPNLTFACEMPRLANGGIKFIKDWIERTDRPRLVIVDTLAMVRSPARKDQSSYDADYAAVKELRDLAAEHGIAIIIVHHLRKAEADDPFDTVSGTLGLTGCPDSIMIIWREGNGVLLAAKGRDIEEIKKSVQFDPVTCTWNVIGDADAVKRSAERSAIIKAFEEADGEQLGPRQIAEATGMKGGQCAVPDGQNETRRHHQRVLLRQVCPGDKKGGMIMLFSAAELQRMQLSTSDCRDVCREREQRPSNFAADGKRRDH